LFQVETHLVKKFRHLVVQHVKQKFELKLNFCAIVGENVEREAGLLKKIMSFYMWEWLFLLKIPSF
jgi:hypothetical protein